MTFGSSNRAKARLLARRPRATAPLKQSIIWGLLLLIGLFIAGLWVMSRLNLEYSQRTLAELHQRQIETAFTNSLDRVNSRLQQIEQAAQELARLGQSLKNSSSHRQEAELMQRLLERPELEGVGLWYGVGDHRALSGAQVYRAADGVQAVSAQAGLDVRQEFWESLLTESVSPNRFWWTPIYTHPLSGEPVISLIRPLLEGSRVIGVLSTDWQPQSLLALLNRADFSSGARIWLSSGQDRRQAQPQDEARSGAILDQIEQHLMFETVRASMQHDSYRIAGEPLELYYATTRAGLRLTAAVPRDEVNAVLLPLQENSNRILLLGGLAILLLSTPILFKVTAPLCELKASYTDELTGLPNRARLLQELQHESGVTLILINLDRFREINGLFGDACGDYILKEVALRLEGYISSMEWHGTRLYRLSGDEFAIQAPRRKPELIEAELEALLRCLRQAPVFWQNHQINLSATLSAAVPWYDAPRQHSLFIHAKEALREARQQGLHYRVYDGSQPLEQQFEHNQIWAGKLREALDSERLVAWYQPILNNTTGRIDKYECLVRMLDAEGNPASPGHFLGVAGKLRLDRHITRIMVERCFARFQDSPLQFSINLAYGDLQDIELTGFILEKLDETGVGPRVIFEILESDSIDNYDQVKEFVDQAKQRGCRIAIDDFGTGYSNFEHLLQLQVDLIKIDASLIRNLDSDTNARRVTRGIVGLARSMKIETVAEFVHSPEIQMEVLRLGISFSQGALIGMPASELMVNVPKELVQQTYCGRSTSVQQLRSPVTGRR
ncbi:sensor domain-containing phosphodiesterase [Marinobacterium iners]|uniref:EAL domain-containing protein n=1 Tax=Marinobacterium iners TaxID=48076 RepID=UPI001A900FF9|nr:EAL domain-containing protein [Marinobacterium iners]QSR33444.1 sensor domain-containing phosphodiesterase [Marinobacterium iners]